MAQFTTGTGTPDDLQKVQAYLYKLNRDLEYMFSHLTPEDNYSPGAYDKWIQDGEKAVQLRVDVDEISATMVTKDGVVAAINLSPEGVKIQGARISLNGAVSVNSSTGVPTVTIDNETGAITANSGLFKGSIQIARGNNIGLYCDGTLFQFGDFYVADEYGRQILQSTDEATGMSGRAPQAGFWYLWAGYNAYTGTAAFYVDSTGNTSINGTLYYRGESLHDYIEEIVGDLIDDGGDDGGDGPSIDGDQDPGNGPGV